MFAALAVPARSRQKVRICGLRWITADVRGLIRHVRLWTTPADGPRTRLRVSEPTVSMVVGRGRPKPRRRGGGRVSGRGAGWRTASASIRSRSPPPNASPRTTSRPSSRCSARCSSRWTPPSRSCVEVKSADFYRPAHAKIFAAIEHLFGRGEPIDIITVGGPPRGGRASSRAVGGKPYLLTVTNVVPTAANAMHYAGIVKRAATMRRLIDAGTRIAGSATRPATRWARSSRSAERMLFEVTNERVASNFRDLTELLKKGFEQIAELSEQKRHITGVPTGFTDLDRILAGMHRGDLLILAARPSVGKTALRAQLRRQRGEGGREGRRLQPGDVVRAAHPAHPVLRGAHRQPAPAHRLRRRRRLAQDHGGAWAASTSATSTWTTPPASSILEVQEQGAAAVQGRAGRGSSSWTTCS